MSEWNEQVVSGSSRGVRGGNVNISPNNLAASGRSYYGPANESRYVGFRVASIPEPATGVLVMAGLLGPAGWRSRDV